MGNLYTLRDTSTGFTQKAVAKAMPAAPGKAVRQTPRTEPEPVDDKGTTMRTLVIEDNPKMASAIAQGLKEQGYAVDTFHTGFFWPSLGML